MWYSIDAELSALSNHAIHVHITGTDPVVNPVEATVEGETTEGSEWHGNWEGFQSAEFAKEVTVPWTWNWSVNESFGFIETRIAENKGVGAVE